MKKALVVVVLAGVFLACLPGAEALAQQAAKPQPPGAGMWPATGGRVGGPVVQAKRGAVVLSLVMPGTGEWLNRDFAGSFPVSECVFGYICCFVTLSSSLDAAAGDRSEKVRLDFWTKPVPSQ